MISSPISTSLPSQIQSSRLQQKAVCRTFTSSVTTPQDTYLNGTNATYYDIMYQRWQEDPKSVHSSWDAYFRSGSFMVPPSLGGSLPSQGIANAVPTITDTAFRVHSLIQAYRRRGYTGASIDPLNINNRTEASPSQSQEYHLLSEKDFNTQVDLNSVCIAGIEKMFSNRSSVTVKEIYDRLREIYHTTVGYEFDHLINHEESEWLAQAIESSAPVTKEERTYALDALSDCHLLETFIRTKYNIKRFGIEGGESVSVLLSEFMRRQIDLRTDTFVFGMAHRGRLNILANLAKKPQEYLFGEQEGKTDASTPFEHDKDGVYRSKQNYFLSVSDIKYHNGWSETYKFINGKEISVSVLPNPSHLEIVNPIALGKVRSKQELRNDKNGDTVVPIIIHGDASFAGQGLNYETLQMHCLPNFKVGGTLHVIINNQLGFTTIPRDGRSGPYCSDLAKGFQIPIFHVNSDDVDSVIRVARIASEYRAKFHKDVLIDFVCFRRFGHNEQDQPRFTQPLLYSAVDKHADIYSIYTQKLLDEKFISKEELESLAEKKNHKIREAFDVSKNIDMSDQPSQYVKKQWSNIKGPQDRCKLFPTNVPVPKQKELSKGQVSVPSDFTLHRGIQHAYKEREKFLQDNKIDWSTAEALSFATQLAEGYPVRIVGQDTQRGTFANRLSVVMDQKTDNEYIPQNHVADKQATFSPVNSFLSEYAVLSYEYGVTIDNPDRQVIWEAQFGDFMNTAQAVLDTFITSAEFRWKKQSNLVLLLPHGYEGQGPEHSSCRIERFLAYANDDPEEFAQDEVLARQRITMQVANITTASNYFHILRRQLKSDFRKPQLIASPKSILRHPGVSTTYEEQADPKGFQPVIPAKVKNASQVKRHVVCSGKQYYEIEKVLETKGLTDVIAVTRLEELSPFPHKQMSEADAKFKNAEQVFCQEEHMNMGPWNYVKPRLATAVSKHRGANPKIRYIGRSPNAVVSAGAVSLHEAEIEVFMKEQTTL